MEFKSFSVVQLDADDLNPLCGGAAFSTTSSSGGYTDSAGADDDRGGGDSDTGEKEELDPCGC